MRYSDDSRLEVVHDCVRVLGRFASEDHPVQLFGRLGMQISDHGNILAGILSCSSSPDGAVSPLAGDRHTTLAWGAAPPAPHRPSRRTMEHQNERIDWPMPLTSRPFGLLTLNRRQFWAQAGHFCKSLDPNLPITLPKCSPAAFNLGALPHSPDPAARPDSKIIFHTPCPGMGGVAEGCRPEDPSE